MELKFSITGYTQNSYPKMLKTSLEGDDRGRAGCAAEQRDVMRRIRPRECRQTVTVTTLFAKVAGNWRSGDAAGP